MRLFISMMAAVVSAVGGEWREAEAGWVYEFPRDHGDHPEFKTEWWYFTGNVTDAEGKEFGYQLTFFRQGVIPGAPRHVSRFAANHMYFAHFAVSDLSGGKFFHTQTASRGAFGEAGVTAEGPRIGDWSAKVVGEHAFRLRAAGPEFAVDLEVAAVRPPVMHGADGISRKGSADGQASHYYSLTRMATTGTIRIGDRDHAVTGATWFDHEWATNQLGKDQVGWDWLSVHFEDGSDLMLFQIRTTDGGRDPFSSGTWIGADGRVEAISNADFALEPVRSWASPHSSGKYPVAWNVRIPRLGVAFTAEAVMDDQELVLFPFAYWEGSVAVRGADGRRIGRGYLEMTGYSGKLKGMQR